MSAFTFVRNRFERFVLHFISRNAVVDVLKRKYDFTTAHQILWDAKAPVMRGDGARVQVTACVSVCPGHSPDHHSDFGFLLAADPTHHDSSPRHPQTAPSVPHLATAGVCTGWLGASRCHRKEIS